MNTQKLENAGQRRPWFAMLGAVAAAGALALTACSPSSAPPPAEDESPAQVEEDFDLDALIEAAKQEGPITVVDSTGKINDAAEAFTEKYGIQATGVKMKAYEQAEVAIREGQAGNVTNDVFFMADTPTAVGDLLPRGIVESWFPADMADVVDEQFQSPAVTALDTSVWAYNTEVYGDTCPVNNIWQLTEDEWKGLVTFQDPLLKTDHSYWFNEMEEQDDDKVAAAYEALYGEPLETDEESATAEWVKRLAQNSPILTNSDDDAANSVGAPGQSDPFMGFMSTAKFREVEASGLQLGLCAGMNPWSGRAYSKVALIATGTQSPNAAKLFVHFMFTPEGMEAQLADGKQSTNNTAEAPADEPSGVMDVFDEIYIQDSSVAMSDFDRLQDWQDFWRTNYSR